MGRKILFDDQNGDATSAEFTANGQPVTFWCHGGTSGFGGGTVQVQASDDGVEWYDLSLLKFQSKAEPVRITLDAGVKYRSTLTNTTGTTSVNLTITGN